jgi:hypothetical protein
MTTEDSERLEQLVATISARLRPLCAEWPEDAFTEMVRGLAAITLRYEGKGTGVIYDRRTTDRLLEEMKNALDKSVSTRRRHDEEHP